MSTRTRFDVFLSHATPDKPAVEAIAHQLEAEGFRTFVDRWHLVPGKPIHEALQEALKASRTCAVFLGPAKMGPWQNEELYAALETQVRNEDFRVIPVLLPGTVIPERSEQPWFLSRRLWVDFRPGLTDSDAMHRLICGIRGVPPGIGRPGDENLNPDSVCPYLGMETFTEAHAGYFFGRGALTQYLVEKLRQNRFLAVLGPSGSGKSSVVRAGLVPALHQGQLPGSRDWPIVTLKPGANPVENLAFAVAKHPALKEHLGPVALVKDIMADRMALHMNVRLALPEDNPDQRVVIIVDQLEEVFTLCNDEALRRNFVNNLLYATEVAGGRTVVVTTLRADFYHRAAVMPSLADYLSEHQVLVTPMGSEELVEAIEGPARKVGLVFDDGLVEILRNDVLGQPGGLPLLEYALKELWEQREGNRLTLQAYHRIGGVQGAIAARAEAEFQQLSESQQRAARRVLMRLVRPGEGTEDTRRRARLNELGNPDDPTLNHVVQTLAGARLLITGRDEGDGAEQLEVAHEALIRNWPRLRAMLDENREALRTQRRLTEQALEWDQNGRGADWLLRGVALEEASRLAAEADSDSTVLLNPVELAFVTASQRLRNREEKRRRLFSTSLTVLLVIAVATSITGWRFWQQAEEQRRVAEEQRLLAEAREQDANRERVRANAERRAAEEQRQLAELRQREAERQQRIAYARQLAAQARFFKERDPVLSLLLGVQATHAAGDRGRRYAPSTEEALRETLATPIGPLLRDQDDEATAVVISPNGRWMAAGDQNGDIHLWRVRRDVELAQVLQGHDESIRALAISGNSDWLFSGSQGGTLRRWDLDAPDPTRSTLLPHHPAGIWSLAVGPDDRWLAVGLADGTIHIHSLTDERTKIAALQGHEGSINALSVSPDGQWLISGGEDGAIRLWPIARLDDPDIQPRELPGHQGSVFALTMHPDGHWLASGGRDGTVMVWSLEAEDIPPRELRGHGGAVNAVVASANGQWLASASDDRTIRIWRIANDAVTAPLVLRGHDGGIWSLAGDPRGQWLGSAAADGQVRIWRVGEEVAMPVVLRSHEGWVWAVTASPDGRWMASAGHDGIVRLWPTVGVIGEPLLLRGHEDWVWSLAIDPDSRWLASADGAGIIRIWPLGESGVEPRVLQGHRGRIYSVAADPRGRWLASGGADATVRLWSLSSSASDHQILTDNTDEVLDVSFSPDGQRLASGGADATVRIWQLDDPTQAARILRGHEGRVSSVDFSPDGRRLASAGEDGTIRIWSLDDTDRAPRILRGHEGRVLSLTYSPNGSWLASGGSDGTVRIWPTDQTQTVPQVLRGHSGRVWTLDYSADGLWLGSGGADGTVRLWQIDLDDVIDTACSFAGRNFTWDEWQRLMDQPNYRRTCEQLPIHESVYQPLLEAAGEVARSGDLDQVLALLRTVRERAPGLELDPESKARELLRNVDGTP